MGLGELCALLSAMVWAVGVILYRRLGEHLPPLQLNFLKNLIVLGLLLPSIPLLHGFAWPTMGGGDIALALCSGVLGIAIADTLYFHALNRLGAGRIGVIGNLYSPFVVLLSVLWLGERLGAIQIAGFVLVSGGVGLVLRRPAGWRDGEGERLPGIAIGIAAVLLMAISVVMIKRVLEEQPLLWVTTWRLVGALGGMLLLGAVHRGSRRQLRAAAPQRWRSLVLAAFIGQYLAMVLWLAGYKFTQASIAAILNETASVFIVLLAWLMLREPLSRRTAAGVVLAILGVACMLAG